MFNFDYVETLEDPYPHFVLDNFLDINFFDSLQEEVRGIFERSDELDAVRTARVDRYDSSHPAGIFREVGGASFNDGVAVDAIRTTSKKDGSLEKMLGQLVLPENQERFYRLLVPRTLKDPSSLKPLRICTPNTQVGFFDWVFFNNCYVSLKLSAYESNAGFFQHIDHSDKVTALLFYLGFSDGVARKECGTQVYAVAINERKWSENNTPYLDYVEETKLVLKNDISPKPNRLFGFRPSRISWHGVCPAILPKGVRRECLQINLMKSRNYSSNIVRWLYALKSKVKIRSRVKKLLST